MEHCIIKNGNYCAKINLSRGANCVSLRYKDYKILREPDYSKELDNPYLYGMPVLFPVNRISGGSFEFEGRKYVFPINEPHTGCHLHGVLHERKFELISKTENKIICSYTPNSEKEYFGLQNNFKIDIEYELTENGFLHRTEITNLSDKNMPVMIGFHSTFNSDFSNCDNDIKVLAEISEEYERNMKNYLPTGNKPGFDEVSQSISCGEFNPLIKPISRHYRAGKDGRMIIYDADKDISMVYENDEKYKFRLIYCSSDEKYICLEPQNCMANCANSPFEREEAGFDFIEPGKSKVYYSKIYIKEGDFR